MSGGPAATGFVDHDAVDLSRYHAAMRVIRFIDGDGLEHYGRELDGGEAELLHGDPFTGFKPTADRTAIKRLLPPIEPTAILCIGKNYADHAAEMGGNVPEHPLLFMKNPAAVIASGEAIVLPACCMDPPEVDYEGELVVIIGEAAKNVSEADALKHVLGYTIANDVSARTWQKKRSGGQFCRGKSFDTFCPMGPALVTADDIADPQSLRLVTTLNGDTMQNGSTGDMMFTVASLISRLSQDTTLLSGTAILTGTPAGVGAGRDPQVFMGPGDTVSVMIEPIGTLANPVVAADGPGGEK